MRDCRILDVRVDGRFVCVEGREEKGRESESESERACERTDGVCEVGG